MARELRAAPWVASAAALVVLSGCPREGGVDGGTSDASVAGDSGAGLDGGAGSDGGQFLPLGVSGNRLVNSAGQVLQLVGVNNPATYACIGVGLAPTLPGIIYGKGLGIFEGPSDADAVAAIARWHVNVVRIALNEDCWLGINGTQGAYGGSSYQTAIENYVSLLHQFQIYAIVDLHTTSPGSFPSISQQPLPDQDHALDFWTGVATAFKDDPYTIFDVFNEPFVTSQNAQTADPWACWLNGCTIIQSGFPVVGSWQGVGMQTLIDTIRATGATNPVMVGGLDWANDMTGWLSHEPTDSANALMASFHVYDCNACMDSTCWTSQNLPIAQKVPFITGEVGEHDCAHGFIDGYMGFADTHGLSYLGWGWIVGACLGQTSLLKDYSGVPTDFGVGFRDHFLARFPAGLPPLDAGVPGLWQDCTPPTAGQADPCAAEGLVCTPNSAGPSCRLPGEFEPCLTTPGCASSTTQCLALPVFGSRCAQICQTTSDCISAFARCALVGTTDVCVPNTCGPGSNPPNGSSYFAACNSAGTGDGTCIPISTDGGPGLCLAAGSSTGGDCSLSREDGGTSLCASSSVCFEDPNTAQAGCLSICDPAGNGPSCGAYASCWPALSTAGVCINSCGPDAGASACPNGTSCALETQPPALVCLP
jgi:endoglucanase